jgi:Tol biopolymer transport system component
MQFHARLNHGGTLINYDGKLRKVNLKTDSTLSAGVYPAWHPTLPFIAYSTNITRQMFHTLDVNKVEVFDTQSDLILYDLERNEVINVENSPQEFEVFPTWSPDGRWLYYCSAHFEQQDTVKFEAELIRRYQDLKYCIYRKPFDPEKRTFGPSEMVFDAASQGLSATLPRISPDGRWLMLSVGSWGCFHIWHRDADLWLMTLAEDRIRPMDEVNSPSVESYHTWSQNGRWIVFSSRRYDGNYTRPFFAHVDENGRATKPFELPQADPSYHRELMQSYNVPEFLTGPVTITPQSFADALKKPAEQARFKSK